MRTAHEINTETDKYNDVKNVEDESIMNQERRGCHLKKKKTNTTTQNTINIKRIITTTEKQNAKKQKQ